jgi:hypothetical protein
MAGWFVLKRGKPLSAGAAQFGFAGDGSLHVPFAVNGTGITNRRQLAHKQRAFDTVPAVVIPSQLFAPTGELVTLPLSTIDPSAGYSS